MPQLPGVKLSLAFVCEGGTCTIILHAVFFFGDSLNNYNLLVGITFHYLPPHFDLWLSVLFTLRKLNMESYLAYISFVLGTRQCHSHSHSRFLDL